MHVRTYFSILSIYNIIMYMVPFHHVEWNQKMVQIFTRTCAIKLWIEKDHITNYMYWTFSLIKLLKNTHLLELWNVFCVFHERDFHWLKKCLRDDWDDWALNFESFHVLTLSSFNIPLSYIMVFYNFTCNHDFFFVNVARST